jgi:hypothetical protein
MICRKQFRVLITAGFALLVGTHPASALTPQVYCASLAATSCEVLNVDFPTVASYFDTNNFRGNSTNNVLIKYCRNQNFRVVMYAINSVTVTNSSGLSSFSSASQSISIRDKNALAVTVSSFDTATLCALQYNGTYNVLP